MFLVFNEADSDAIFRWLKLYVKNQTKRKQKIQCTQSMDRTFLIKRNKYK